MRAYAVDQIKEFMSLLFKSTVFDAFELRTADVVTYIAYTIDGKLQKDFFTLDEQEALQRKYCLWSEVKPIVFQFIKGSKLPKSIKIVFSLPEAETAAISENASVLFLNLIYENKQLSLVTGSAQKSFSLDKSLDYQWEEYVGSFLKKNNIAVYTD